MKLRLHIERLVLDGVDVPFASRRALRAAVETEMVRLASAGALSPELAGGIAVPAMRAPSIGVDAAPAPAVLGRAIGRSVWSAVGEKRR
jgi:hypothetical protein